MLKFLNFWYGSTTLLSERTNSTAGGLRSPIPASVTSYLSLAGMLPVRSSTTSSLVPFRTTLFSEFFVSCGVLMVQKNPDVK